MNLKDFYFEDKANVGEKMPILLPTGGDSGEWLNVIFPSANAAIKAGRAFFFAYKAKSEEIERLKKGEDETKLAIMMNEHFADLNRQFALEIVNGWSFEEKFSREAFAELLDQYSALGNMVADFHSKQREALQEK